MYIYCFYILHFTAFYILHLLKLIISIRFSYKEYTELLEHIQRRTMKLEKELKEKTWQVRELDVFSLGEG